ncbi:hypothetical protein [Psychroserpens algicola]|uniref:hypothetical protein n=1 Tax=Psychroserpens algicola TaxID=1719034 RepID=UPI001954BF8C|nr:hypothetical protein [Psychroserpens algicola]
MRKQLGTIIIVIILYSIFWSCNKEKKISKSEFEQTVFYEIFPEIIDSVYFDIRLLPPPPPPPNILKEKGYDVEADFNKAYDEYKQSDEFLEIIEKWRKKKDSINLDSTSIYLVLEDSIIGFSRADSTELIKYFNKQNIVVDTIDTGSKKDYRIDLKRLNVNNKKIRFKYRSDFPEGRKFWKTKYDIQIAAKVGFSRILFDKTKSFGLLNVSYVMGTLNGEGIRIYIKKNSNGKWVIDKIKETWIS